MTLRNVSYFALFSYPLGSAVDCRRVTEKTPPTPPIPLPLFSLQSPGTPLPPPPPPPTLESTLTSGLTVPGIASRLAGAERGGGGGGGLAR